MTDDVDEWCEFCGTGLVGGSCPSCAWYEGDDEADTKCPYCFGSGYVNPLTAPEYQFCVGTEPCDACDGEGLIQ